MTLWGNTILRSDTELVRKEDYIPPLIKEALEYYKTNDIMEYPFGDEYRKFNIVTYYIKFGGTGKTFEHTSTVDLTKGDNELLDELIRISQYKGFQRFYLGKNKSK